MSSNYEQWVRSIYSELYIADKNSREKECLSPIRSKEGKSRFRKLFDENYNNLYRELDRIPQPMYGMNTKWLRDYQDSEIQPTIEYALALPDASARVINDWTNNQTNESVMADDLLRLCNIFAWEGFSDVQHALGFRDYMSPFYDQEIFDRSGELSIIWSIIDHGFLFANDSYEGYLAHKRSQNVLYMLLKGQNHKVDLSVLAEIIARVGYDSEKILSSLVSYWKTIRIYSEDDDYPNGFMNYIKNLFITEVLPKIL